MNKALTAIFGNENIMLLLIFVNASIIFVSGFYADSFGFRLIDAFFTLLFLVEAIVKIKAASFREYWSDVWNKFDFILVILALPSLLNLTGDVDVSTSTFLSFRALRVFKAFRLIKFIPHIGNLLRGVKLACKSSFVVSVGMVVLIFVFSILTSTIFGEAAPEYFGNPAISVYSLFRLFTIEGWYDMPDLIAANSSAAMGVFARVYFSVLLFCGGIIGMSLVNSIFVDAMAQDNNDEVLERLDKIAQQLEELQKKQEKSE